MHNPLLYYTILCVQMDIAKVLMALIWQLGTGLSYIHAHICKETCNLTFVKADHQTAKFSDHAVCKV